MENALFARQFPPRSRKTTEKRDTFTTPRTRIPGIASYFFKRPTTVFLLYLSATLFLPSSRRRHLGEPARRPRRHAATTAPGVDASARRANRRIRPGYDAKNHHRRRYRYCDATRNRGTETDMVVAGWTPGLDATTANCARTVRRERTRAGYAAAADRSVRPVLPESATQLMTVVTRTRGTVGDGARTRPGARRTPPPRERYYYYLKNTRAFRGRARVSAGYITVRGWFRSCGLFGHS